MMFCHGLKGEFWLMFIRVVTVSRMRFFGVVFEADFLTMEPQGQKARGRRAEVRGQRVQGKDLLSSREGVFSSVPGVQSVPSQCLSGLAMDVTSYLPRVV